MRFAVITALAALALAGAAVAQSGDRTSYTVSAAEQQGAPFFGGSLADAPPSAKHQAEVQAVRQEMRLACAADRQTLCGDKTASTAGRCLVYHRLKVSAPCRQAIEKVWMAGEGRL